MRHDNVLNNDEMEYNLLDKGKDLYLDSEDHEDEKDVVCLWYSEVDLNNIKNSLEMAQLVLLVILLAGFILFCGVVCATRLQCVNDENGPCNEDKCRWVLCGLFCVLFIGSIILIIISIIACVNS